MVVVVDDDSNPEIEVIAVLKKVRYALCPMPYALCPVVPHLSEKGYKTGKIAGFDFGLKTFLTCSDGSKIESPQFFKQSLNAIKKASRQHSKKLKGSANREGARKNLVRKYEDISTHIPQMWLGFSYQL
jgi:transposase